MSEYVSKRELIDFLKEETKQDRPNDIKIRNIQRYIDDAMVDETEIIRKAFERVVERLEEKSFDMSLENPDCKAVWLDRAKEIVKEECGISE